MNIIENTKDPLEGLPKPLTLEEQDSGHRAAVQALGSWYKKSSETKGGCPLLDAITEIIDMLIETTADRKGSLESWHQWTLAQDKAKEEFTGENVKRVIVLTLYTRWCVMTELGQTTEPFQLPEFLQ